MSFLYLHCSTYNVIIFFREPSGDKYWVFIAQSDWWNRILNNNHPTSTWREAQCIVAHWNTMPSACACTVYLCKQIWIVIYWISTRLKNLWLQQKVHQTSNGGTSYLRKCVRKECLSITERYWLSLRKVLCSVKKCTLYTDSADSEPKSVKT